MRIPLFARACRRATTLLAVMLTLSACATTTGSSAAPEPIAGAETFCRVAQPILWDDADTDETIRQVKAHNAVWKRLCQEGR